jgi:hypothetical protein
MLTEQEVLDELNDLKQFRALVPYITRLANIYIFAGMDQGTILYCCIANAAVDSKNNVTKTGYHSAFHKHCVGFDAEAARSVYTPADRLDLPLNKRASDIAKLRRLRSDKSTSNGLRLATCALRWKDKFKWVSSGPRQPGTTYQSGPEFGITTSATHQLKENSDVLETFKNPKVNDFAKWLVDHGPKPNENSFMNCWEAIFFCASEAGLITREWLEQLHKNAAQNYKVANYGSNTLLGGAERYQGVLERAFNLQNSVCYRPADRVFPQKGDIVIWGDFEHVALSLGPSPLYDEICNVVIGLWHDPMKCNTMEEVSMYFKNPPQFVPCPF